MTDNETDGNNHFFLPLPLGLALAVAVLEHVCLGFGGVLVFCWSYADLVLI